LKEPNVITYTNLLHKHGCPCSKHIKAYVKKHEDDKVFMRRVKVLNELFELKKELVDCSDSRCESSELPVWCYFLPIVISIVMYAITILGTWWWLGLLPYLWK